MTPERYREILGAEAEGMTDEEVEELLRELHVLADVVVAGNIRQEREGAAVVASVETEEDGPP